MTEIKETSILDMIETVEQMRKRSVYDAGRIKVMNNEMTMLKAIGYNPGMHVIGLARILGITKGAVSQTLSKLEKKGLIEKLPDPSNASRLIIKLTVSGEEIYEKHERFHEELNALVESILNEASDENRRFLNDFLTRVNDKIGQEYNILGEYLEGGDCAD